MKIQHRFITLGLGAMLTLGTVSLTWAAGLGIVDYNYLMQQHPDYRNAVVNYQTAVQKDRQEFDAVANTKTETEKKQLIANYNTQLEKQRVALFSPIDQSIVAAIKKVQREKSLDFVAVKGFVVTGNTVDITNEVAEKLK